MVCAELDGDVDAEWQVDKLSTMLLRELLDMSKKAEQEKTQRSCVQR